MNLYGVVANAGVMMCPWGLTKDGFEMQVGTNHMSVERAASRKLFRGKPFSYAVATFAW